MFNSYREKYDKDQHTPTRKLLRNWIDEENQFQALTSIRNEYALREDTLITLRPTTWTALTAFRFEVSSEKLRESQLIRNADSTILLINTT